MYGKVASGAFAAGYELFIRSLKQCKNLRFLKEPLRFLFKLTFMQIMIFLFKKRIIRELHSIDKQTRISDTVSYIVVIIFLMAKSFTFKDMELKFKAELGRGQQGTVYLVEEPTTN